MFVCVYAQRVQEWGATNPNSFLLYQQRLRVVQTNPGGTAILRRTIQYPAWVRNLFTLLVQKWDEKVIYIIPFNLTKADDESVPIGYIRVTHVADGIFSNAQLGWGGPGNKFVGIEFVSPPGRNIHAVIQIFF